VPGVTDQAFEDLDIELIGLEAKPIARRAGDHHVRAEELPKLRDEILEGSGRGTRWPLTPQRIYQAVGRDDLAGVQEEQREEGPLLWAPKGNDSVFGGYLEGAEDPELVHGLVF
jgi:hypothetical protein